MPVELYRFRLDRPGLDLGQLKTEVPDPLVAVSDYSGGLFLDVQADSTALPDLVEALSERGYIYLGTNPTTSPRRDLNISQGVVDDVLVDDVTREPLADDVLCNLLENY